MTGEDHNKDGTCNISPSSPLRLIGGYFWYMLIEKMHLDLEIPRLNTYIKNLNFKLYADAKFSQK